MLSRLKRAVIGRDGPIRRPLDLRDSISFFGFVVRRIEDDTPPGVPKKRQRPKT